MREAHLQNRLWENQGFWYLFYRSAQNSLGHRCTWFRWYSYRGHCTCLRTGDQCRRCQWPMWLAASQQGKTPGTIGNEQTWKTRNKSLKAIKRNNTSLAIWSINNGKLLLMYQLKGKKIQLKENGGKWDLPFQEKAIYLLIVGSLFF